MTERSPQKEAMEYGSEFDGRQKTGVGSCIVHATQKGYREISVIRGSASRLPGLLHHTEPHFSVPALAPSLVPKLHPSATPQPHLAPVSKARLAKLNPDRLAIRRHQERRPVSDRPAPVVDIRSRIPRCEYQIPKFAPVATPCGASVCDSGLASLSESGSSQ